LEVGQDVAADRDKLKIPPLIFPINGNTENKANAVLQDTEVIRYSKEVAALPQEDKIGLLR